jgi:hypothetical protein
MTPKFTCGNIPGSCTHVDDDETCVFSGIQKGEGIYPLKVNTILVGADKLKYQDLHQSVTKKHLKAKMKYAT